MTVQQQPHCKLFPLCVRLCVFAALSVGTQEHNNYKRRSSVFNSSLILAAQLQEQYTTVIQQQWHSRSCASRVPSYAGGSSPGRMLGTSQLVANGWSGNRQELQEERSKFPLERLCNKCDVILDKLMNVDKRSDMFQRFGSCSCWLGGNLWRWWIGHSQ